MNDDCGCCEGVGVEAPDPLDNPPGRGAPETSRGFGFVLLPAWRPQRPLRSPSQQQPRPKPNAATPKELWTIFWQRRTRVVEHGDVRIEYLHWGDDTGEGRIRHCRFRVPRYLLSGGVGYSWEWLTEVKPDESWR